MPFSLALMAKMRHRIFNEVKQRSFKKKDASGTNSLQRLMDHLVPEERALFLEQCNDFFIECMFLYLCSG